MPQQQEIIYHLHGGKKSQDLIEYRRSVDMMQKYLISQRCHIQKYISGKVNNIGSHDLFTIELKQELDSNVKFTKSYKKYSWFRILKSLSTPNLTTAWIAFRKEQDAELYKKYARSGKDMDDLCTRYKNYLMNSGRSVGVKLKPFELRFIHESCDLKLVKKYT
jgi:hypothetical protein